MHACMADKKMDVFEEGHNAEDVLPQLVQRALRAAQVPSEGPECHAACHPCTMAKRARLTCAPPSEPGWVTACSSWLPLDQGMCSCVTAPTC